MKKVRLNTIIAMDCLEGLKLLESNTIQCCVTSPPYWHLRNYQVEGQLGMEDKLEDYVQKLVAVFDQVWRVLRPDGVLWLNLGDCYWGSHKGKKKARYLKNVSGLGLEAAAGLQLGVPTVGQNKDLKHKDLIGLPWMVAFALRKKGWYLRQEIIWHKKNGMPESVKDRCTRSHETIFMFSKSPDYYYNHDAIKTPLADSTLKDVRLLQRSAYNRLKNYSANATEGGLSQECYKSGGKLSVTRRDKQGRMGPRHARFNKRWKSRIETGMFKGGANRRTVWALPYQPFKGNHFATFPPALPELCIKAGSKPGDIILDPFMGAGTTGLVAKSLHRHYIGFELNPDYVRMAEERIADNKDSNGKK